MAQRVKSRHVVMHLYLLLYVTLTRFTRFVSFFIMCLCRIVFIMFLCPMISVEIHGFVYFSFDVILYAILRSLCV